MYALDGAVHHNGPIMSPRAVSAPSLCSLTSLSVRLRIRDGRHAKHITKVVKTAQIAFFLTYTGLRLIFFCMTAHPNGYGHGYRHGHGHGQSSKY